MWSYLFLLAVVFAVVTLAEDADSTASRRNHAYAAAGMAVVFAFATVTSESKVLGSSIAISDGHAMRDALRASWRPSPVACGGTSFRSSRELREEACDGPGCVLHPCVRVAWINLDLSQTFHRPAGVWDFPGSSDPTVW